MSKQKILFDANIIIELHQLSLWDSVLQACHGAVTPIILREARFYRDSQGQKLPINLNKDVVDQKIEELSVSIETYNALQNVLRDSFLEGIDEGEREAIAFLHAFRENNPYLFCTADQLAIKCLGVLNLECQGIALQDLFESIGIKVNPGLKRHSRLLFEKMLNEGAQESECKSQVIFSK